MSTTQNRRKGSDRRKTPRADPDRRANWPVSEKDSVFRCPHCKAVLGTTNGQALTVGAVIITDRIALICVACKQPYEWRPR